MSDYNNYLKELPQRALSNIDIDKLMAKYDLGLLKYVGTFPKNRIPPLFYDHDRKTDGFCAIVNNDSGAGEHWVAIIKYNGDTYMYDSFFRESEDEELGFPKKWVEPTTIRKIGQGLSETNCGARCIAFIRVAAKCGVENAFKYL